MLGARFDPTKKIAICESVSDVFILTFFSDSQCNPKKNSQHDDETPFRLSSADGIMGFCSVVSHDPTCQQEECDSNGFP